jgi:dihydroorotase
VIDEYSKKFADHDKAHPPKAAIDGVKKLNKLARKYLRRVHFCHMTTAAEVIAAKQGNKPLAIVAPLGEKRNIFTCEVSPHHLFLSTSDLPKLKEMGICNPPLRQKAEVAKLWKCINNIDCIASDHAPHTMADKQKGAPGFPGVQTMIPLLLHAVLGKKLNISRAVELFSQGPARDFTMFRKGRIAPGYDADLIMFDTHQNWKVSASDLYSKAGWSPYEGWCLRGKILGTFVRGEQAYWDGEILVRPGYGERAQRTAQIGTERLVLRKHSKER